MVTLTQHAVQLDGVRLSYVERAAEGEDGKPPFLLLHGLVANSGTFLALIAELPRDRRVIALDLPASDLPGRTVPQDMSLQDLARLVCRFTEAVRLERPVILGHSHGGAIAMQIAVMFPGSLSGLVLLCPAHPFLLIERRLVAFYNSWPGQVFARMLRWVPRRLYGVGFKRLLGPEGRKVPIDVMPYRERLLEPETVTRILRLLKTWNADMDGLGVEIATNKISIPTLFLWGDHDPVVPIETAAALRVHFQNWEQVTLHGIGHLPNDEAAAECGRSIRTWLAGQQRGL